MIWCVLYIRMQKWSVRKCPLLLLLLYFRRFIFCACAKKAKISGFISDHKLLVTVDSASDGQFFLLGFWLFPEPILPHRKLPAPEKLFSPGRKKCLDSRETTLASDRQTFYFFLIWRIFLSGKKTNDGVLYTVLILLTLYPDKGTRKGQIRFVWEALLQIFDHYLNFPLCWSMQSFFFPPKKNWQIPPFRTRSTFARTMGRACERSPTADAHYYIQQSCDHRPRKKSPPNKNF